MRVWSLHPKYLDRQGLLAAWRESLLARKVLEGKTRGYRSHPQLARFMEQEDPVQAINSYLFYIKKEAERRGYSFADRCGCGRTRMKIPVTEGQLGYELSHLRRKLKRRSPGKLREIRDTRKPEPHPLFRAVKGPAERWENPKKY